MPLTIIVSNRLPVSVKRVDGRLEFSPSDGGLATGLASYTKGRRSLWVGWPGITSEELTEEDKRQIQKVLRKDNLVPVFLTKTQVDNFYSGYSNSILWPLFHGLPFKLNSHTRFWKSYKEVNELFSASVSGVIQPKSVVWVHDYQLLLVPKLLRASKASIGFFLHIPFPSPSAMKVLPEAKQLLQGILGANLVGFHTKSYGKEFFDCCNFFNVGVAENGQVILPSRSVRVAHFPIGIDYNKFAEAVSTKEVKKEIALLKKKYRQYKIVLTVDRLDPSKGFIERLEAYFAFLDTNPNLHGTVKLIMLTIPSRTDVKAYSDLKKRIDELVAMTNDTFGSSDWQPIDFMYTSVPFTKLSALYHIADVAFVTPIKDGMNLVSKEYIASKQNRGGVLILSETAGAAEELTEALLVNPKKRASLIAALNQALSMPAPVNIQRLKNMQQKLSKNNIHTWAMKFIHSMEESYKPVRAYTKSLNERRSKQIKKQFLDAKKRLIMLDYDGVLVRFYNDPKNAKPSKKLMSILEILSVDERNKVVVLSGRMKQQLERWLGHLPVDFAAEHGAYIKQNNSWRTAFETTENWKQYIEPVLRLYADKTKGAFVEEKEQALVWHYRSSPPYQAQKNLTILKRILKPELRRLNLKTYMGNMILEIKPPALQKGAAAREWLKKSHDNVIIIGDDYTDEDMFKVAPESAITIKVGAGRTLARYRLSSVDSVIEFLSSLQ